MWDHIDIRENIDLRLTKYIKILKSVLHSCIVLLTALLPYLKEKRDSQTWFCILLICPACRRHWGKDAEIQQKLSWSSTKYWAEVQQNIELKYNKNWAEIQLRFELKYVIKIWVKYNKILAEIRLKLKLKDNTIWGEYYSIGNCQSQSTKT